MAENHLLLFLSLVILVTVGNSEVRFFFDNNCLQTLWVASSPSDDVDSENGPGVLEISDLPDPWRGTVWVRTKCTTNLTGYFSCETGDCGIGQEYCNGRPPAYPVTQLNFDIKNNVVSYEVSLRHGHNIAVRIEPTGGSLVEGGSGPCPVVDCVQDISNVCPARLVATNKNGAYVGCYNPCDVLHDPKYCRSNDYSLRFKQLCDKAHTFPGDNVPPVYKCKGATSFNITFCPL